MSISSRSLLLLLAALTFITTVPALAQENRLLHAILVKVNGNRITQADLDEVAEYLFGKYFPGRPFNTIRREEVDELSGKAMQELIRINLILDEVEKRDIEIDDERKQRFYRIMKIDPVTASRTLKRMADADAAFDKLMSLDGKSYTKPGPKEIRDFWNKNKDSLFITQRRVKVRHIFLNSQLGDPGVLKKQADMLRDNLDKTPLNERTTKFAKFAEEFSQGRFRSLGGLLLIGNDDEGWFNQDFPNRGRDADEIFPEAMVRAIRGLRNPGDMSDVVQSEKGFHLLYLEDAKGGEQIPFSKAQTYIEWNLTEIARRQYQYQWMKRKMETSVVTWNDGTAYPIDRILPSKPNEDSQQNALRNAIQ